MEGNRQGEIDDEGARVDLRPSLHRSREVTAIEVLQLRPIEERDGLGYPQVLHELLAFEEESSLGHAKGVVGQLLCGELRVDIGVVVIPRPSHEASPHFAKR